MKRFCLVNNRILFTEGITSGEFVVLDNTYAIKQLIYELWQQMNALKHKQSCNLSHYNNISLNYTTAILNFEGWRNENKDNFESIIYTWASIDLLTVVWSQLRDFICSNITGEIIVIWFHIASLLILFW